VCLSGRKNPKPSGGPVDCQSNVLYSVYILRCSDQTLYTGSTCDLEKRLHEHNHTQAGAKYTRGRRPAKLVYVKRFKTLAKARKAEAAIKRLARAQKNELIEAYGSFTNNEKPN